MASKGSQALSPAAPSRSRLRATIKGSLRELSVRLALLNHHVGAQADLRPVDLLCLDIVTRQGPLSPSALARVAGLHPATVTGILDRLEQGGWVARDRDASDRRAVLVRALPGRSRELTGLYGGMNAAMDGICADYDDAELALLADFLKRTGEAGRGAAERLARA